MRGLAPRRVTTAVWSTDRYVLETRAREDMRDGLRAGASVGAVIGGIVGAAALPFSWTAPPLWAALLLGLVFGAGGGALLGGYVGINRHQQELWDERDWTHVDLADGEILLIVSSDEPDEAVAVLDGHGRIVEPVHP